MTPSTSTSTASPRPRRFRRAAGALALALLAAGAGTVTSGLLGAGPTVASADPGDTFVPTGSSQLFQSEDLDAAVVPLDSGHVVLGRDGDFSSCLGEGTSWTQVLPGSPKPVSILWTRRGHRDQTLAESLAQAPTEAQAKKWAATLVASGVQACRKPTTDFHYGPVHTDPVGSGVASWAVSYRGKQTHASGGVAVVRQGTSVGFVQVSGSWGPSGQTMESVAKLATQRLG